MRIRRRETIHLGVLYSLTGPYCLVGREMLNGHMLAVEHVNSNAEFEFRFSPLVFDPGGDLQNYHEHCELLIRDKGVRHIVGCYTSASRKQVLPLIERYDRLLWHSARYEASRTATTSSMSAAPNQHIVPLAHHMIETLGTSVYCVGANYLWTWETTRVLQEIVSAAGGELLAKRLVPLWDSEITYVVRDILERRPPIISTRWSARQAIVSIASCIARSPATMPAPPGQGRPTVLSCSLCEPELRLIGPRASVGHITSSVYFSSIETPENRAFVRRYRAMFGRSNLPSVDAEALFLYGLLLARPFAGQAQPMSPRCAPQSTAMNCRHRKGPSGSIRKTIIAT